MMSVPECNENGSSQKRPVLDFIRRLSVKQQSRSQQWQYFRPARRDPRKTEVLDNSTSQSFSHMCDADHRGDEQYHYASSWVDVADELTAENGNNDSPPMNVDTCVASTSQDTASGVEHPVVGVARVECERPALPESHSSLAHAVDTGEEEMVVSGSVRDKIRRAKTHTIRSFNAAVPRLKRGHPPPSQTRQHKEKDTTDALLHIEGKQQKPADAEDAEQSARDSEEIEKLRRDLSESRSLIVELQKRLEAQSRDLESSNNFFNTADKSSDSDVIRALQRLNAEVQQNTTYMADCLAEDFEFENPTNSTEEQTSAVQRVSRRIGNVLMTSFRTTTPEDIPMLLQIALQAYFSSVLCQAVSSWAFEPGYNRFIREIHQRLRRVEAQAISGRWRSLTRAHNLHGWITHPESLVKGILADISDIALAAGCTAPQSDVVTRVASKFREKTSLLVELAGGLSKTFDEVISSDFEVFITMPGEKFKDKMMEDADDGHAGTLEGASVLCATHIGLTKRVPVGTLWEKGRKEKVMVLKAKVLLESFLNTELED